jgi:hypothetical protein
VSSGDDSMAAKHFSQAHGQFRSDLADGSGYQNPFHTASCGLRFCGPLSVGKVTMGQLASNLGRVTHAPFPLFLIKTNR